MCIIVIRLLSRTLAVAVTQRQGSQERWPRSSLMRSWQHRWTKSTILSYKKLACLKISITIIINYNYYIHNILIHISNNNQRIVQCRFLGNIFIAGNVQFAATSNCRQKDVTAITTGQYTYLSHQVRNAGNRQTYVARFKWFYRGANAIIVFFIPYKLKQ